MPNFTFKKVIKKFVKLCLLSREIVLNPIHFDEIFQLIFFFSTYSRKRPHTHSPPLRSPEPIAKKHCSRPTPPASPARPSRRATANSTPNGVTNGHSNGNR